VIIPGTNPTGESPMITGPSPAPKLREANRIHRIRLVDAQVQKSGGDPPVIS
jgi:hypothetical protein